MCAFSSIVLILPPETFGLVALTMVYIALLQVFLEQGFVEAVVHSRSTNNSYLNTAFWTIFFLSAVLCVISIMGAPLVGSLFGEPELPPVLKGLAPLLLLRGSISVHLALLQRKMKFGKLAAASMVGVLCGGMAGIISALVGLGVWSLVIFQLVNRLVESIIIWINSSWRPGWEIKSEEWPDLFRFGGSVTGSHLVNFVNRYGADLIIGLFFGPAAVGLYTLSFRIIRTLVNLFGSVISTVCFPLFSQLQDDQKTGRELFGSLIQQISLLSCPMFIGLALCAEEVVAVFFGDEWRAAVPLIQSLSFIGLLHSLYYLNNAVLLGYGKPQWELGINLLNSVVNTIVFIIAAQWNVMAVACGYVLRGYLLAPLPLFAVSRLLCFSFTSYVRNILFPLISTFVMSVCLLAFKSIMGNTVNPLVMLIAQVLLGGLVYFLIIYIISPQILKKTYHYFRVALSSLRGSTA